MIQKKVAPLCCTSAESSTTSLLLHSQPTPPALKLEPSCGRNLISASRHHHHHHHKKKKKGAAVGFCDGGAAAHSSDHEGSKQRYGMEEEGVVCSMCGDVGIAELLFFCSKCSHRPQHIYCSRSYPDVGREASICNWCLHEEDSMASSTASKATLVLHGANAHSKASKAITAIACANANVMRPIKELINCPAAHVNVALQDEVSVKKGHSKAFEYLLLIAAQSLPQVNSEASGEIKQEVKQEIKQQNHSASMLNITNPPKISSLDYKLNCDLDRKLSMGHIGNQGNIINSSKRLIMGLDTKQLHSDISIKLDDKMDVGVFGGSIRCKRLRCGKGINASFKCRKKGLQLSPSRPNYRRYKLLADVVC